MRAGEAALELAERACRAADGDEADVLVHSERSGFARFAASSVHQPTLVEDASVTLRVVRDGKVGAVTTNRTDDEGLRAAGRRAAQAAGMYRALVARRLRHEHLDDLASEIRRRKAADVARDELA